MPMDGQGLIPDDLERLARKHDAQLLCTSPEMHNPTGLFTPLSRRREIAEVARRTGLHILEDDCYRVGRAHEQAYRALLPEQAWYVSSISKTITPALRIGFAVALFVTTVALQSGDAALLAAYAEAKTGDMLKLGALLSFAAGPIAFGISKIIGLKRIETPEDLEREIAAMS